MRYYRIIGEHPRLFRLDERGGTTRVDQFVDDDGCTYMFSEEKVAELKGLGKYTGTWGYLVFTDNPDDYLPGEAEKILPWDEEGENVSVGDK